MKFIGSRVILVGALILAPALLIRGTPCILESERELSMLGLQSNNTNVTSMAFSPDSALLVSAQDDGRMSVYFQNFGGNYEYQYSIVVVGNLSDPDAGFATDIAFSPDGRQLAAAIYQGPNQEAVVLFQVNGTVLTINDFISGRSSYGVAYTADGTFLLVVDEDTTFILYEMAVGPVYRGELNARTPNYIQGPPAGLIISPQFNNPVAITPVKDYGSIHMTQIDRVNSSLMVASSGLSCGWNSSVPAPLSPVFSDHQFSWSPPGELYFQVCAGEPTRLFRRNPLSHVAAGWNEEWKEPSKNPVAVAIHPNELMVAAGYAEGGVSLFEALYEIGGVNPGCPAGLSGNGWYCFFEEVEFPQLFAGVTALRFSPDGNRLATITNGKLTLFDVLCDDGTKSEDGTTSNSDGASDGMDGTTSDVENSKTGESTMVGRLIGILVGSVVAVLAVVCMAIIVGVLVPCCICTLVFSTAASIAGGYTFSRDSWSLGRMMSFGVQPKVANAADIFSRDQRPYDL